MNDDPAFQRFVLLTGTETFTFLQNCRVIIFGLGGVGSWCAEALIRSGIRNLTIVDSDVVCVTNINRQIQATHETIGKSKVELMQTRLLQINPVARIHALQKVFSKQTADQFDFHSFDYVIDAIDSLSNKVELIIRSSNSGAKVYSALGASNKLDSSKIKVGSLWESQGCHLGRFVRKRLRRRGFTDEVMCVYSDELFESTPMNVCCTNETCFCPHATHLPEDQQNDSAETRSIEWCKQKKQINGSAVHITAQFGFMLAGLVIQDVYKRLTHPVS